MSTFIYLLFLLSYTHADTQIPYYAGTCKLEGYENGSRKIDERLAVFLHVARGQEALGERGSCVDVHSITLVKEKTPLFGERARFDCEERRRALKSRD